MAKVSNWKLDDRSGTTILDSKGVSDGTWVGTNLVTNGDGSEADISLDWTTNTAAAWAVVGGEIVGTQDGNATHKFLGQDCGCTPGRQYTVSIEITANTLSTAFYMSSTGAFGTVLVATAGSTTNYTAVHTAVASATDLILRIASGTANGESITIDNITIREHVEPANPGLVFDGVNDYINTNATYQTTFDGSFSVSIWFEADDGQPAAADWLFGSNLSDTDTIVCGITTLGKLAFVYESNNNQVLAGSDAAMLSNGAETLHNMVCVADSTIAGVGGLKIYFDGVVVALAAGSTGDTSGVTFADFVTTLKPYIGAANADGTEANNFAGNVHEVELYNEALTANQARTIYLEGLGTLERLDRRERY